jgi:hypothetical protein
MPLTAAFPFLSVTFVGFFISMFALHLTQYACGISIQLSVHLSVVVFETHVERGDTRKRRGREEVRKWVISAGSALKSAFSAVLPISGTRISLTLRNLLDDFLYDFEKHSIVQSHRTLRLKL